MHSGASVAQPCLACGAGRETRTPTPKRWYLKPMRLPIPPYPHVGRRYVTMFRKGQARLIAAFRFLRTFLISRAGGRRRPRSPLIRHPRWGTGRNSGTEAIWRGKRQAAPHPPPSPDIIYSAPRSPVTGLPAPCSRPAIEGLSHPVPPLIRSSLTPSHCRSPRRPPKAHKLVTNYA